MFEQCPKNNCEQLILQLPTSKLSKKLLHMEWSQQVWIRKWNARVESGKTCHQFPCNDLHWARYNVPGTIGDTMSKMVFDIVIRLNMPIWGLRAQTYDVADQMYSVDSLKSVTEFVGTYLLRLRFDVPLHASWQPSLLGLLWKCIAMSFSASPSFFCRLLAPSTYLYGRVFLPAVWQRGQPFSFSLL